MAWRSQRSVFLSQSRFKAALHSPLDDLGSFPLVATGAFASHESWGIQAFCNWVPKRRIERGLSSEQRVTLACSMGEGRSDVLPAQDLS